MSNSDYICQKCHKPLAILEALGKVRTNQGYLQCVDCYSDLEYESVVVRDIHYKRERNEGIPYPKWLHDELEAKGLIRKINVDKHLTEKEEAALEKFIIKTKNQVTVPLDKWEKMSKKKRELLICGKNNCKLKKVIKKKNCKRKKVIKGLKIE